MSQHHPLMSPTLYTPHGFGMRDRPDTQENFDTHFHHSSTLTLCAGFVFFYFILLESEQAKVIFVLFFSVCLLGTAAWAGGILSRCEKTRGERVCLA